MVGDCRRGRCPHRPGDLDASEGGSASTAWAGVTATAGATSELSRILIDTAVMGNSSEFDLEVKLLRMEGMSAEEAWRQTFTDYVERVVDTGVRSGRYGLIAGLSEYGGEYFRQHPEAFNALVNGKTGWSGGMRGLPPGGAQGLLELPSTHLTHEGAGVQSIPTPQGPAAVKDDWETALEEAMAERGVGDPENVDISGESGIINIKEIPTYHFSDLTEKQIIEIAKAYRERSPIEIPGYAAYQAKSMTDGYEQIIYKWSNEGFKYEVRWHTRTSGAPTDQGATWVVQRRLPGSGAIKGSSAFFVDGTWIPGYQWYAAIAARKAGTATPEQIELLDKGHWKD